MSPAAIRIVQDDVSGSAMIDLLRYHGEQMQANTPEGSCHFLDLSGIRAADVTVWSAWVDGSLAGCGALKELAPAHGELKSMRTAPLFLGQGVGRAVLNHILDIARDRRYHRVSLETGSSAAFAAAIHLYEATGFVACGPFGTYTDDPFSRFYTLDLQPPES